jgi:hypothetical protein
LAYIPFIEMEVSRPSIYTSGSQPFLACGTQKNRKSKEKN